MITTQQSYINLHKGIIAKGKPIAYELRDNINNGVILRHISYIVVKNRQKEFDPQKKKSRIVYIYE